MLRVYVSFIVISFVFAYRYEDDNDNRVWTSYHEVNPPKYIDTSNLGRLNLNKLPKVYDGKNGSVLYIESFLIFNCYDPLLLTDIFPPLKNMKISQIAIEDCTLPTKPLAEVFQELNINVTDIKFLRLSVNNFHVLPKGNYTEGLKNIVILWIHTPYSNSFLENNPGFMLPFTNLTSLMTTGSELPTLTPHWKLKDLSLEGYATVQNWDGYCQNLVNLKVLNVNVEQLPQKWPENCSQLVSLTLGDMKENVAKHLLSSGINSSCTNLKTLTMSMTNLTSLPSEVLNVAATSLNNLALLRNRLTDNELLDFPAMPNLTSLDLSRNRLTGWVLFDVVKKVPALRFLDLGLNNFLNLFCNFGTRINRFTSDVMSLEKLWLYGMPMNVDCLRNAHFSKLTYLNMAYADNITVLEFQKLPRTDSSQLSVDLSGRSVDAISFTGVDYQYFSKGESSTEGYENKKHGLSVVFTLGVNNETNLKVFPKVSTYWRSNYNSERTRLTVLLSPIDCDCKHYWLALALRNLNNVVSLPGLLCKNTGAEIVKEPLENLYCRKYNKLGCIQRQTETTDVDSNFDRPLEETIECHNPESENEEYPIYQSRFKIVSLNVTDNHMENLHKVKIVDTMQWLDLRRNRISRLDMNDTTRIFAKPDRRVWLGQNLFVCDCENAMMIDAFHEHRKQIVDFDEIMCIDSGVPLSSVTSYEVCQYGLKAALSSTGVVAALLMLAAILLWHYRLQIKIYLYSKGLCLFCLSEDDIDSDRPYDAFLSFSHGDEEYVIDNLLPKLESEPNHYKICVHYRDWGVGEWIPAQIMRSVRLSKRTIIVLSRDFVGSLWGSLEFRYSAATTSQEGRTRLLVLVLDDVMSLPLDEELKDYLKYNTYLRCDDPWFWEKLRYTMPRQKRTAEEILRQPEENLCNARGDELLMNNILSNSSNLSSSQVSIQMHNHDFNVH